MSHLDVDAYLKMQERIKYREDRPDSSSAEPSREVPTISMRNEGSSAPNTDHSVGAIPTNITVPLPKTSFGVRNYNRRVGRAGRPRGSRAVRPRLRPFATRFTAAARSLLFRGCISDLLSHQGQINRLQNMDKELAAKFQKYVEEQMAAKAARERESSLQVQVPTPSKSRVKPPRPSNQSTESSQNPPVSSKAVLSAKPVPSKARPSTEPVSSKAGPLAEPVSSKARLSAKAVPSKARPSTEPVSSKVGPSAKSVPSKAGPSAKPVSSKARPSAEPVSSKTRPSAEPVSSKAGPSAKRVPYKARLSAKPVSSKTGPSAEPVSSKAGPSAKPVPSKAGPSAKPDSSKARPSAEPVSSKTRPSAEPVSSKAGPSAKRGPYKARLSAKPVSSKTGPSAEPVSSKAGPLAKPVPSKARPSTEPVSSKARPSAEPVSSKAGFSAKPVPSKARPSTEPVSSKARSLAEPVSSKAGLSAKTVPSKAGPSAKPVSSKTAPSAKPVSSKAAPSAKPVSSKAGPSAKSVSSKAGPSAEPVSPKAGPSRLQSAGQYFLSPTDLSDEELNLDTTLDALIHDEEMDELQELLLNHGMSTFQDDIKKEIPTTPPFSDEMDCEIDLEEIFPSHETFSGINLEKSPEKIHLQENQDIIEILDSDYEPLSNSEECEEIPPTTVVNTQIVSASKAVVADETPVAAQNARVLAIKQVTSETANPSNVPLYKTAEAENPKPAPEGTIVYNPTVAGKPPPLVSLRKTAAGSPPPLVSLRKTAAGSPPPLVLLKKTDAGYPPKLPTIKKSVPENSQTVLVHKTAVVDNLPRVAVIQPTGETPHSMVVKPPTVAVNPPAIELNPVTVSIKPPPLIDTPLTVGVNPPAMEVKQLSAVDIPPTEVIPVAFVADTPTVSVYSNDDDTPEYVEPITPLRLKKRLPLYSRSRGCVPGTFIKLTGSHFYGSRHLTTDTPPDCSEQSDSDDESEIPILLPIESDSEETTEKPTEAGSPPLLGSLKKTAAGSPHNLVPSQPKVIPDLLNSPVTSVHEVITNEDDGNEERLLASPSYDVPELDSMFHEDGLSEALSYVTKDFDAYDSNINETMSTQTPLSGNSEDIAGPSGIVPQKKKRGQKSSRRKATVRLATPRPARPSRARTARSITGVRSTFSDLSEICGRVRTSTELKTLATGHKAFVGGGLPPFKIPPPKEVKQIFQEAASLGQKIRSCPPSEEEEVIEDIVGWLMDNPAEDRYQKENPDANKHPFF